MNKKKILIVTYGFYPEISPRSFRATELVKEFVRQGHEVTVVAPAKEGLENFLSDYSIDFIDIGEVTWKVPVIPSNASVVQLFNRVLVRLSSLLFEYPLIQLKGKVAKALKKLKGYDLLISIAVPYPIHWGVSSIWKKNADTNPAKIWVADCGDPYMGQENDTFSPPFYFAWKEKSFCRKADYLSLPTDNSYVGYYPEFHEKVVVIPQGFKFEDYRVNQTKRNDDKLIFGYGGMFIPGRRDPREFLEFLLSVKNDFEFHVYTNSPQYVESFAQRSKNIKLFPVIDRMELMKRFSSMDFLVNFTNVGKAQTPSKLIDYAILGKPIMNIETGNLQKEMVLEFLNKNYSKSIVIQNPEQYRIENVCSQFLSLLK
jgi:glycosyltransferase involved in cell wall biosynthesis